MRLDKLTTKFQQALGDAQSMAVVQDQQFIEPLHVLSALLAQDDGASASLLSRAGPTCRACATRSTSDFPPKVEGIRRRVRFRAS
jgi:ATP-dependent Clp protease ATP-binding subunit ClpB